APVLAAVVAALAVVPSRSPRPAPSLWGAPAGKDPGFLPTAPVAAQARAPAAAVAVAVAAAVPSVWWRRRRERAHPSGGQHDHRVGHKSLQSGIFVRDSRTRVRPQ